MIRFIIYTMTTQIDVNIAEEHSVFLQEQLKQSMQGLTAPNALLCFDVINMVIRADCVIGYRFVPLANDRNRKTKIVRP